jgi:hypothetical protein
MRKWMPAPAPGRGPGGDRTRTSNSWIGVFVAGSPFGQVSKWVMGIQLGCLNGKDMKKWDTIDVTVVVYYIQV